MTEKDLEREIRILRGDLSKLAEMLPDAGVLEMSSEILIFAPRNIPIGELCVGSDIPNIKRQLGLLLLAPVIQPSWAMRLSTNQHERPRWS